MSDATKLGSISRINRMFTDMINRFVPLFIVIGFLMIIYAVVLIFMGDWENGIGYLIFGIVDLITCKIVLTMRKWWRD